METIRLRAGEIPWDSMIVLTLMGVLAVFLYVSIGTQVAGMMPITAAMQCVAAEAAECRNYIPWQAHTVAAVTVLLAGVTVGRFGYKLNGSKKK